MLEEPKRMKAKTHNFVGNKGKNIELSPNTNWHHNTHKKHLPHPELPTLKPKEDTKAKPKTKV
jgi:hypothetical protein